MIAPDTITSWVLSGLSLNSAKGLGVSSSETKVRTLQEYHAVESGLGGHFTLPNLDPPLPQPPLIVQICLDFIGIFLYFLKGLSSF